MSAIMSPHRLPAAPIQFGPFSFDYESRLLLRDGVPRHLSPKAHELLRVLIARRPRAVSRQELFDALWPATFVVESNLASVMNELRRALEDDPRRPRFIRTVHSFGYAFCGEPGDGPAVSYLVSDGRLFPLTPGENLIGRGEGVRVLLADTTVSRRHARITIGEDGIWVEDLGSKNGTFVDGRAVTEATKIDRKSILVFGAVGARIGSPLQTGSTAPSRKLDMSLVRGIMERQTTP